MSGGEMIAIGTGLLGLATGAVSLIQFGSARRAAVMAEGKKAADDEAQKARIQAIDTRVSCLEKDSQTVEVQLAEIKVILERVVVDVAALGQKLDIVREGR